MNWDAIGASAEAIGVVGILVSLVYLATQIRQNTQQISRGIEASRLAAFERNIETGNHFRELLILHPDLARLFLHGLESYSALAAEEKFRFGLLLRNLFSAMQGAYIRQLSVDHDPVGFDAAARIMDELLVNPGAQEWLETNEPDWRPAFREFVYHRLQVVRQQAGTSPE